MIRKNEIEVECGRYVGEVDRVGEVEDEGESDTICDIYSKKP